MMNKKIPLIFSVPPFMSPNEDFAKNEHQLNSIAESFNVHLDFLKNQMFCLKIKDFFKNNSEAEQISFQATQDSDQDGDWIDVSVCVDGDFDDNVNHFFVKICQKLIKIIYTNLCPS